MAVDPTMQFLAELDDPAKWHVVHNVPVVRPHERTTTDANGKKRTVKVTEQDLPGIAKTINTAYQSAGVPIRVTIGHIKHDPDADETSQPPVCGFAREAKAGTFGPGKIPGVMVDLYVRKDQARSILTNYPFRSMEFDPIDRRIYGVAMLARDPALDLGVVTYRSRKWIVNYEDTKADEPPKGDPTKGETGDKEADPMPGEDVGAVTLDTGTEEDNAPILEQADADPMGEDVQYQGFCKMMQRYIASGGLSAMGPMGGLMPQAEMIPAAGEAPAKYQRGKAVSNAIDAEVASLKASLAALKKERDEQAAARLLEPLREAVKFNYAKEQATLVALPTDEARAEHAQYMRENYAPLLEAQVRGPMFRTRDSQGVEPPRGDKPGREGVYEAPDRYQEIMSYMKTAKLYGADAYERAEAAVMAKYTKVAN